MARVCLDPGHGIETAGKRSPDGTYLEHEFNLDMSRRIKAILERHSVSVTVTRTTANDVTLANRVRTANSIPNLDLFVSIHSNASGEGWTSPSGYGIYTYSAGATAARNIAANKLLAQARAAGIAMWGGGLHHNSTLYVLKNTKAPAILIEHGFHTNRAEVKLLKSIAYRDKLAEVDCKGILDYLGIAWQDNAPKAEVKPMATVKGGSRGDDVRTLQTLLNERGYNVGTADGIFGPKTQIGVFAFQRDNGLIADCIVGPMTWRVLLGESPAQAAYRVQNGIHIRAVDVKDFALEMCNKRKKSAAAKDYCNAGFFAGYKEGGVSFTLPVGHLVCDFSAAEAVVRKYCTERGKFITPTKYQFDCSKWTYNNNFAGKALSTLFVSGGSAKIVDTVTLPAGLDYAITGVPIMRDGKDVLFTSYVRGQGWDGSTLYGTWHVFLGLKQNDNKIYVMGMRTTSGNMILTAEAYRKFKALGMYDVIKLDGGGSFHMNVGGKVVASTAEDRLINTIVRFE